MPIFRGNTDGAGLRIGIVVSRWNSDITGSLQRGAERALIACGVAESDIIIAEVPGAFEIPIGCAELASSSKVDAIAALGCVIKGETAHFEYVSDAAMQGIREVALQYLIPVTCGILTSYTMEQALERAGDNEDNKGSEAALAAIEMAQLQKMLR
jgi:6,7-dimethyl-8-ribityllumazine synthase